MCGEIKKKCLKFKLGLSQQSLRDKFNELTKLNKKRKIRGYRDENFFKLKSKYYAAIEVFESDFLSFKNELKKKDQFYLLIVHSSSQKAQRFLYWLMRRPNARKGRENKQS